MRAILGLEPYTYNWPSMFRLCCLLGALLCAAAFPVAGIGADYSFPAPAELPSHDRLPGILVAPDGSAVRDPGDWEQQRRYLKAMLAHYLYGNMPPVPEDLRIEQREEELVHDGAAVRILGVIPIRRGGETVEIRVGIIRPVDRGELPVVVKNDTFRFDLDEIADESSRRMYRERRRDEIEEFVHQEAIRRGYALCKFIRTDVAADSPDSRDTGVLRLYPEYDWRTIAAWAWAHSVVLSALENEDGIDTSKNAATGHSRGGKTALCAGIYDSRIAVTAPNSSGTGGTGSAIYFDPEQKPQTIAATTSSFPHWFLPRFREFAGHEERMPFDAHTAKAAVAPRALFNAHARHDFWANPYGTYLTHEAARRVYRWLGVEDRIALHWRDGGHNQDEEDWRALLDFCDYHFFSKGNIDFESNPYPGKYELLDRLPRFPAR